MHVSVVIPTYNRAQLVCESIRSVLRQTHQDFSVIVVDDGSTDETEKVLQSFEDKILYIKQDNRGPGGARNRGMKEAKGKYIAFLDSDDLWFEFKLELQVAMMEKWPEIGFLSTDFCIKRDSGEEIHSGLRSWHKEYRPWNEVYEKNIWYSSLDLPPLTPETDFKVYVGNLYHKLLRDPYVLPSSTIIRRDFLAEDIRFPEGVFLYEDWEFFALLSRKYDAAFLDLETTINRGHSDKVRLTHCSPIKAAENRLRLIDRVWKSDPIFIKKYSEEVSRVEGEQMLKLAKGFIFEYKVESARKILKRWKNLKIRDGRFEALLLKIFAHLPGGSKALVFIRNLRRLFIVRRFAGVVGKT